MKKYIFIFIAIAIFTAAGYSQISSASPPPSVHTIAIEKGKEEEILALATRKFQLDGIASFYGAKFHERTTANGEVYNMRAYTAAHRTLPFNTVVEVTNENNGQKVAVRINDRGPYLHNRVIDLSQKAAESIGMIESGIAPVTLKIVHLGQIKKTHLLTDSSPVIKYQSPVTIQVASYSQQENANRLITTLKHHNINAEKEIQNNFYRVVISNLPALKVQPMLSILNTIGFNKVLVREQ